VTEDEAVVEFYLKPIVIFPMRNFELFKFKGPVTIYVSKGATLDDLIRNIREPLMLRMPREHKSVVINEIKLWKYLGSEPDELVAIDKEKFRHFTHVPINAEVIAEPKDDKTKSVEDLNIAETDLVIVEIPKKKDEWVLLPQQESESETKAQIQVQLEGLTLEEYEAYMKKDITEALKKSSNMGLVGL